MTKTETMTAYQQKVESARQEMIAAKEDMERYQRRYDEALAKFVGAKEMYCGWLEMEVLVEKQ